MEVSGTLLRQVTYVSGAGTPTHSSFSRRPVAVCGGARSHQVVVARGGLRVSARPRRVSVSVPGFCDEGHVQYYEASVSASTRCGGEDKKRGSGVLTTKKKLKLLKGLSKGLSLFPELGFSLDPQKPSLLDQVQGNLTSTSDAAEVLLKQLEQVRAEEKELKRKKKQEKAKLKASRMKNVPDCESSSSSSESSDSECGEVVDVNSLRAGVVSATVDELQPLTQEASMLSPPALLSQTTIEEHPPEDANAHQHVHAMELCSRNDTCLSSITVGFKNETAVVTTAPQNRIEVCMGNKCKKSGAAALFQEFERVMGVEGGAVIGCKCMGKCKSAPNVRVQNSVDDGLAEGLNDSVMIPANPLCIGVGLEDVDTIVARFFGENQKDIGMAAAAI